MKIVKIIGLIFLAAYLILGGLFQISEVRLSPVIQIGLQLLAIAAGVLILISLGGRPYEHPK